MRIPWGMVQGAASLAIVMLILIWEAMAPTRLRSRGVLRRWVRNVTVGGIGILVTHAIPGGTLMAVSAWGRSEGIGLLKAVPSPWAIFMTALILDLALWAQHRVSHEWAWLWRLHRVHHGDQAMDSSTAFRFHPLELGVSLAWKSFVALLLGGPLAGVLLFEGMLFAGNLFEHANGRLPSPMEKTLRLVLVTPRLHAIHHSPNPSDQRANYGFFFIWWDRLFRTFQTHPEDSRSQAMGLGDGRDRTVREMLLQPFEPYQTRGWGA